MYNRQHGGGIDFLHEMEEISHGGSLSLDPPIKMPEIELGKFVLRPPPSEE
jgi:hypothetical protein